VFSSFDETFIIKEEFLDTLTVGEYDIMLYTGINAFPITAVVTNSGNTCYNVRIDTDSASPSVLLKGDYDGSDVDFYYRIDGGSQTKVIGTHQVVLPGISGDDSFDYEVKPSSLSTYDTIYTWDPDSAAASFFASTYTFMGETHDYYLASQEELNNYIYYSCFDRTGALVSPEHPYGYKQMPTSVYIDFDFGGSLFESGGELSIALESMPIKGFSVSCIDISSPGSLTFTVFYSYSGTLNSTPNTYISSQESWFPSHVEAGDYDIRGVARGASYNAFAIESITETQSVSTSEQLFAAVLAGVKPSCVTSSIAADIYEEAKDVLREIITDDMTDYEKVHAIYDWLIFNVEYDLDMLDELVELQALYNLSDPDEYSEYYSEVLKYRCFYLEGVFLDNLAVCDGFAKAFVLLARIEGIEAIKISGTIISSGENHAWNKVNIEGNWYTVDSTWGNYIVHSTSPESYSEYMNHAYLLVSDAEMFASHRESGPYPASPESYGYYQSIFAGVGVDYYIEDQSDFDDLMDEIFSSGYPTSDVYVEIYNASGLSFLNLFSSCGNIPVGFKITNPGRNVSYYEIREGAEGTLGDHIVLIEFDS
jgi:hypothetical protein